MSDQEHDPLCRAQHMTVETDIDDLAGCDCALIAKVRADERDRTLNDPGYERRDRRLRGETLADLRAKVEGLPAGSLLSPHAPACPGRPGYRGICNCERLPRQYLWRADVLALFPEEEVSE